MTSNRPHKLTLLLLAALSLLLSHCSSPIDGYPGTTYTGRVTKVADGDTFTLVTKSGKKHRVRLARIDASERRLE